MKTTNGKLQVTLTIVALMFLVFLAVGNTAAGQRPSLSKKEVKALIASARTKEDHLKLADYYNAQTARLEAEAKDHDAMAEYYRQNPPRTTKFQVFGEEHFKEIARRFRESAAKAQKLAAMHEQVAATAEQK